MRKISLIILVLSLTTASFGQKAFILNHIDRQGFVALSAGGSLPLGMFASRETIGEKPTLGQALNLAAGYRLYGPIGLMVRGEQQNNAVDTQALLGTYPATVSNGTALADTWSVLTVLAGPYVSVPLGRWAVDARLLVGQSWARLPSTRMLGTLNPVEPSVRTVGVPGVGLALGGGASLRYRLGRTLAVQLNADYSQASFRFDNVQTMAVSLAGARSSVYSSERLVSTVSASVGIVFLFHTKYYPF